jgi:uncharacterized protein (TIGR00730 family)
MSRFSRICVFCGSNTGSNPAYARAARDLGKLLAAQKLTLVYGGGKIGLMGELADAVLSAGGEAIGVIPHSLVRKELAHAGLTDLRIVDTMHERKSLMADLADAFIALPGGFGTLDEFCEILTWAQLGLHRKPCALLNTAGYYDHLLALFDHAVAERFLPPQHRAMLVVSDDPQELLQQMSSSEPVTAEKVITRRDR